MSGLSAPAQVASSLGPQHSVRGVRLLSFDGGGIRGLSSLIILDQVMARIKHDEGLSEDPLPCEYFDLIGGTGTGGLIAIMLGRLRMSVPQAIAQYANLAENVFSEMTPKFTQYGPFKASKLENAIKGVVNSFTSDDGRMLDPLPAHDVCKTFVCAMPLYNMGAPRLFRTYLVRDNKSANCFIWEAARATSAAPTFFERFAIVDDNGLKEVFIDGGFGCNNPVSQLIEEAGRVFHDRRIACIVSIGTGQAETIGLPSPDVSQRLLPTKLVDVLWKMAVDCEAEAERVEKQFRSTPGIYFRLNVEQGLQQVLVAEWQKISEVTQHTKTYLQKELITQKVNVLVQVIRAQIRFRMNLC